MLVLLKFNGDDILGVKSWKFLCRENISRRI